MRAHAEDTMYVEGIDFKVDYENGRIYRTLESRIPDWSMHPLCGIREFDHTQYSDYSNLSYTMYVKYEYESESFKKVASPNRLQYAELELFLTKLRYGKEVAIMIFGDSISTGADTSVENKSYFERLSSDLRSRYPGCRIHIDNRSIGGETSEDGIARIHNELENIQPDLAIVGFGMNDQNKYAHGNGVPLARYESNMIAIVNAMREKHAAALILLTPCEPNPEWQHTSGDLARYAETLRRIGKERNVPIADVHRLWMSELEAGKSPESLLLNNINHPNDYGHWIYYEALRDLFFPCSE
ncbi:SGNH/GDSL hydrolase family protein [Paenibacillus sacheonensis]|uniref:SGNH hydrolase-type esterase domain-containing protein n=1 Tax=Paenibacillus sacheonensis TaxID=742054 RepID=A0A7X5C550_9BACL|nr:SGNH/GDSL hydrolase family protein [Paenibacillus sacheonensis]MBM7569199.1 lysophospholipase L1-like esterase [Paenibacillus sacheonensis]NBC73024.1 hypothetical protein [Paenibacillus sacheonensis]